MTVRTRTALLAATVLLALAACAGPAAPARPATDTRAVTDQYGQVTITGSPQRVVAPNSPASDIALELGVPLVAQGEWGLVEGGIPAWRQPLLTGDVPVILYSADYNIEETLGYAPDLVLAGFDMSEDVYRRLSAVVPVVSPAFDESSEATVLAIGEALGLREQAQALLDETDAEIAAAAERFPQLAGKTIAIATAGDSGTLYNGGAPLIENFWTSGIGLLPAPGMSVLSDFDAVGAEQWQAFDGDLLYVGFTSAEQQAQFESMELFQRIPAVAAGRYLASPDLWDFEYLRAISPAHIRHALENFLPRLAAVAG